MCVCLSVDVAAVSAACSERTCDRVECDHRVVPYTGVVGDALVGCGDKHPKCGQIRLIRLGVILGHHDQITLL